MKQEINFRIESEIEINTYLQALRYALDNDAKITFQVERRVDSERDIRYTNKYTVAKIFPDENPVDALRRELRELSATEYMRTVKDIKFPKRSEMRVFGKVYNGSSDVYIKIRVELLGDFGNHVVFIMSFHFAENKFLDDMFPYKK